MFKNQWALILGGSSGLGLASARKLAEQGMNICIVHRDRKGARERVEKAFETIRATGCRFLSHNVDALSAEGRQQVLDSLQQRFGKQDAVRLLFHSIAWGNLKGVEDLCDEDLELTFRSMGSSILIWTQEVLKRGLFERDARVLGLTSEGNTFAFPKYAAVAAAKAAMESLSRAMAVELAPRGIRSNMIQAGIVDTPALRMIPGSEKMIEAALKRNPYGRLTTPEDVANVVALLCTDQAAWINGSIIHVDGGEHLGSGF